MFYQSIVCWIVHELVLSWMCLMNSTVFLSPTYLRALIEELQVSFLNTDLSDWCGFSPDDIKCCCVFLYVCLFCPSSFTTNEVAWSNHQELLHHLFRKIIATSQEQTTKRYCWDRVESSQHDLKIQRRWDTIIIPLYSIHSDFTWIEM